ncbi:reverse transcriptase domain, reverse transcriptase zinc-binding domain protein [Tanacetum coccineum]
MMERGLRQGDPLSLFLFLIVAEALQVSIIEACNKGIFKGMYLTNNRENISLLQIAGDALFFKEWSRENAKNLIHILHCFKEALGPKINLTKSRLFGISVANEDLTDVASSLGCTHDELPFIYLGLHVGKRMRFCDRWANIIDHFRSKLSAWKEKSLSIGGRLTLIKSILRSLPIYYLSLYKVPSKVINALEYIRSRFFWGFKENQRGISWVKWKTILLALANKGGFSTIKKIFITHMVKVMFILRLEMQAGFACMIAFLDNKPTTSLSKGSYTGYF